VPPVDQVVGDVLRDSGVKRFIRRPAGVRMGLSQPLGRGEPVRKLLRCFNGPPAPRVGQQMPDAAAARPTEQAAHPLRELVAVPQEGEHRPRVVAGQPLAFVYGLTPCRTRRLWNNLLLPDAAPVGLREPACLLEATWRGATPKG